MNYYLAKIYTYEGNNLYELVRADDPESAYKKVVLVYGVPNWIDRIEVSHTIE